MALVDWDTVEGWVDDWLDTINNAFDSAMQTLTVTPFSSTITVIDTAMAAV